MSRPGSGTSELDGARLGIDIGGTFMDLALYWPGRGLVVHKELADAEDLARSVLRAIDGLAREVGLTAGELLGRLRQIVHGTTVATNAVLTHRGARTGLLTTAGTRDALEMRRGVKERPLDNHFHGPPVLVPRRLRLGVPERIDSAGAELEPVDLPALEALLDELAAARVEAVAVCLMHAYATDDHERLVAEAVRRRLPEAYLTMSSELLPRLGYYGRLSTAVLNSYVGPTLAAYVGQLQGALERGGFRGDLLVMTSAGGVLTPREIERTAAVALLSGPSAAPVAGGVVLRRTGGGQAVVIDMGGTSLDVSLVAGGEPVTRDDGTIGGYALGLPMVDVHTLGAGGGSLAWLDEGGALHVGPESAGSRPGPACYGLGGTRPTATDANVVLGLIDPERFLGGRMPLDGAAARSAILRHVADPLGLSVEEAAAAIYDIVDANMASSIRSMVVDRGLDPAALTLVAGGGAGPLHAGALALELGIREILVPRESGVLCAYGMLFADLRSDLVRTYRVPGDRIDASRWAGILRSAEAVARARLTSAGAADGEVEIERSADVRYARQQHDLRVRLEGDEHLRPDAAALKARYDQVHLRSFGYAIPGEAIDLVNLRVSAVARRRPIDLPPPVYPTGTVSASRRAWVVGGERFASVAIVSPAALRARHAGPALVDLPETTIVVPEDFDVELEPAVGLRLTRRAA